MASKPATRKVTANLPRALLEKACRHTGKGVTDTIVEGLAMLERREAGERMARLAGKLKLDVDLDVSRERTRH
jgi:hypothetical protein